MKTFEDYLREIHAKNYNGTDDDMPDAYEHWLGNEEVDAIIAYADGYGEECFNLGINKQLI